MDYDKMNSLKSTRDAEPLIYQTFLIEGQFTDLCLYPQGLEILQKGKQRFIPFQFGQNFGIIQGVDKQLLGFQFTCGEEKIVFTREFGFDARKWQAMLLKYLIRTKFHSFFKPLRKLGTGHFASVYLAQDLKNNRHSALKAFVKQSLIKGESKASLANEVKIMRKLKHPNLIQLYGVYQSNNSLYLSMQYAKGISLETLIRKKCEITISNRRKIIKGLLFGLKQLSRLRIVHRDLKPENIIISQNCQMVKIIDFGLATHIDEEKYIYVRCGTPGYVAPEILRIRDTQKARLGVQSDIYSLGVIYYQLIYGKPLFNGKDVAQVLTLNRLSFIKLPPASNVAFGQLQLLQSMLSNDPWSRVTPYEALKNNFFKENRQICCRALQPISIDQSTNHFC